MRDYSNMPVLKWENAFSTKKAMAQVEHEEPVILEMPETFAMDFDFSAGGCEATPTNGLYVECDAKTIITQ